MNQAVSDYIENLKTKPKQEWQAQVCNQIRETVHRSIPGVEERIQYGKPHFLKNGKYAGVLGTAKEWVTYTIFNAESLEAPIGFFEAGGPDERKTVKIRSGETVDTALLGKLIAQAAGKIA